MYVNAGKVCLILAYASMQGVTAAAAAGLPAALSALAGHCLGS
jgi:hypothetical protein